MHYSEAKRPTAVAPEATGSSAKQSKAGHAQVLLIITPEGRAGKTENEGGVGVGGGGGTLLFLSGFHEDSCHPPECLRLACTFHHRERDTRV